MSNQPHEAFEEQLASYQKANRRELQKQGEKTSGPAWTRFAAAAGASLAAVADADGAIQHVVPSSPVRVDILSGPLLAGIDVDGVGGYDLGIGIDATYNGFPYYGSRLIGSLFPVGSGSVAGANAVGPFGRQIAKLISAGETIQAQSPPIEGTLLAASLFSYNTFSANVITSAGYFGIYFGSVTGYAGFVNNNSGGPHAGWVKIRTVPFNNGGVTRLRAVEVLEWAYEDTAGASILAGQTESAGLPGDYNDDGTVDAADYTVWRDHLGQTFQLDNEDPSDANPGEVDQDDYEFWVSQFGASSGATHSEFAGSVPEPTSIGLGALALGAAGVAALRRRKDE